MNMNGSNFMWGLCIGGAVPERSAEVLLRQLLSLPCWQSVWPFEHIVSWYRGLGHSNFLPGAHQCLQRPFCLDIVSCHSEHTDTWYLETARTLILIWMSATITYILPNYIIYPMYIAIFWRGFRRSFHPFFVLGKRFPIQASSPSSKMRSQRSNPGARWMVLNFPWEHPHFDAGGMMQGGLPPWLRKPPDDE